MKLNPLQNTKDQFLTETTRAASPWSAVSLINLSPAQQERGPLLHYLLRQWLLPPPRLHSSWLALMKIECVGLRRNSGVLKSFFNPCCLSVISDSFNSLTLDSLLPAQTLRSRSLTTVTMGSTLQCYWLGWVSCFPTTVSSLTWTTCTTSLKVQLCMSTNEPMYALTERAWISQTQMHVHIQLPEVMALVWVCLCVCFRDVHRVRHEPDLHPGGSVGRHPQQRAGGEAQHAHQDHCG